MTITSLAIQSTYSLVQCALFHNNKLIETITLDKHVASKQLLPMLSDILHAHNLVLRDLSFISANTGPAPFTTLRVVIATVNGLNFASNIPLIGVDGLQAIMAENTQSHATPTVLLLNAFNKDVYFAIQNPEDGKIKKGCQNIITLLQTLYDSFPQTTSVRFIGNGALMYATEIENLFKKHALIEQGSLDSCSIQQIGLMGWESWQHQKNLSKKLLPLYLKGQTKK